MIADKVIPYRIVTAEDGAEVDRRDAGLTTVREHCRRCNEYTAQQHEWEFDDAGAIVAAVTRIERARDRAMTGRQKRAIAAAESAVAVSLAEVERLVGTDVRRIMDGSAPTCPPEVDWTPAPPRDAVSERLIEALTIPEAGQ